jgi:hypothetical protein
MKTAALAVVVLTLAACGDGGSHRPASATPAASWRVPALTPLRTVAYTAGRSDERGAWARYDTASGEAERAKRDFDAYVARLSKVTEGRERDELRDLIDGAAARYESRVAEAHAWLDQWEALPAK